jgi:3-hydroxyacyl-[acyl-carrier-protein] dehydratase
MMDIREIEEILPHRYPFLLVDRVVEVVPGQKLIAYKNVTVNEPFFSGHFPGHPVMPGVLIVEALAQASALLACKSGGSSKDKVIYLMAIDNARFRKPVRPGDRLQLEVEIVKRKGNIWKEKGVATVDGARVAEAEFMATMVDKTAEPAASAE